MARCDPLACVAQCWRGGDVDARLRNQLEVHQARVRGVNAEIATLTAAALAARRANQRAEAISCMKQIRLRQAKRHKYEQMAHFCQQTLDRVNDLESVHETMAALGDVRRQYGQIKMDELYERFGAAVQDVTEGNHAASDVHHLLESHGGLGADDVDEETLMRELAALDGDDAAAQGVALDAKLPDGVAARSTAVGVPAATLRPPALASMYAAAGVQLAIT